MREANDRGYDCLLVEDCCAASEAKLHEAAVEMVRTEGGIFGATAKVADVLEGIAQFTPTLTEDGTLIGSAVGTADSVVLRVVTLPLCDITGLMVTVLKTWAVLGANVWGAVFADDATVDVIVVVVLGGGTKRENMGAVDASVIELVKVLVFVE
ncbi:hypothetical protein LTR01_006350 [Friedmanniomyces endolithicus]|nr:hypothetical protein LTS09_014161 [Friedmanniomyces endolithicus]KAK0306492.1 hypothetical protein LTR01_006350 [Friedmanniomyces endolithicus]KAK0824249.1 hypothetical protein LTR73_007931 [Friedmanniomyces endolithicus]